VAGQENTADLLARAIQAVREKRREEGRQLLMQILERDQYNEQAWLWLSGVMDDPRDMQVALANALTINPGNAQARKGLDMLRQRHGDLLEPGGEPPPTGAEVPAAAPTAAPDAREEEEEVYIFQCYSCQAEVNSMAHFCWNCHAVIHCCENCVNRRETECKERHNIRGPAAAVVRNRCLEWYPG